MIVVVAINKTTSAVTAAIACAGEGHDPGRGFAQQL